MMATATRLWAHVALVAAILMIMALLFLWPTRTAHGAEFSCDTVRYYVKLYGRPRAIRWARAQGYTWREIAAAGTCLRG